MADLTDGAVVVAWLNVAVALAGFMLATAIIAVRPHAMVNRLLATFIFLLGWGGIHHGAALLVRGSEWAYAAQSVFYVFVFPAAGILYIAFAAHAVPRPWTGFLRTRPARWALVALIPVVWLSVALIGPRTAWLLTVWEAMLLAAALFALVSAIAHRRATTGARRRKATMYLAAFGIHDAGFIVGLTIHLILRLRYGLDTSGSDLFHPAALAADGIIAFGSLGLITLLTAGLFRSQLLDFNFRLHLGLSRGTIAAIFIGLFFVVSELAANLLSERLGPVMGIVAAGLLVFAIAPLQRLGDRVGSAIVDDPRPLTALSSLEHEQVLRDQIEIALEDGVLTIPELKMIEAVRKRLGIAPETAARIQQEATAAMA